MAIFANFEAIRVQKAQITKIVFKILYKSVPRFIFAHISESRYSSFFQKIRIFEPYYIQP